MKELKTEQADNTHPPGPADFPVCPDHPLNICAHAGLFLLKG
jgi:hypothetical protein